MNAASVGEPMSDVDALVWAVEREPRLRTTIAALVQFEAPLDPVELRCRIDRVTRAVPRLRQRVIDDRPGPTTPRWAPDVDFRLSFHLRRVQLSEPTEARLLAVVRDLVVQPFDRARPLWECTVIEGLEQGGSALLVKAHHSLSDGVGGVEMLAELFDPLVASGSPARPDQPASPPPNDDLVTLARRIGECLGAATRVSCPGGDDRMIGRTRSAGLDLRTISIPLDRLRHAARRAGGTVNDAFVAAVALGTARHFGDPGSTNTLRIAIPISTRAGAVHGTGNHWVPGRLAVTVGPEADPVALTGQVHLRMRSVREDPVVRLLPAVAAPLRCVPPGAIAAGVTTLTGRLDLAVSNITGSPLPLGLCGQNVTAVVPFGPLSGCAINVTLLSVAGTVHIGVATDPAAVDHPDELCRDLSAALTTITNPS